MGVISASAAIVVPAVSFYLTKRKEQEADWRKYKFEQYREFLIALSGIVGTDATPENQRRFALASNTLNLFGSQSALEALREFWDEIKASNPSRSDVRHDALLSKLIWAMRNDLDVPTPDIERFVARLWCSGLPPTSS